MKNTLLVVVTTIAFIGIAILVSCRKKPTDNINLKVNTDIFQYIAVVKISDAANASQIPANIVVSISGDDADYIYAVTGKKLFTTNNGVLQLAVDPKKVPAAGNPVSFNVEISAAGYLPVTANIKIQPGQTRPAYNVRMINLNTPPAGMVIKPQVVNLSGGALSSPGIFQAAKITGDSTYYDNGISTVVLPQGTTFYYYKTQTNLVQGTKQIPITSDSSVQYGDITHVYTRITGYYNEEYSYLSTSLVKTAYTGATVTVIPIYQPGSNVDYILYPMSDPYGTNANGTPGLVQLLNGTSVTENNLLFKTAVQQKLVGVYFIGTITDATTGKTKQICISPDSSYHWFTSMVIDPTFINPITSQPIKAGDSIEAGIVTDNTGTHTIHAAVKKGNNGQLRIETQSPDAGYYYDAPYKNTVSVSADVSVDTNTIPDIENLNGYTYLQYTGAGSGSGYMFNFYQYFIPQPGPSKILSWTYALNSAFQVQQTQNITAAYYWNKQLTNKSGQGQSAFGMPFLYTLDPIVEFNLTFNCSSKSYYPTYSGSDIINGNNGYIGYFYFNMINGRWRTRGVQQGVTYNLGAPVCDGSYATINFVINGTKIVKSYSDPVICNCYF